jgi:hypothetical protein
MLNRESENAYDDASLWNTWRLVDEQTVSKQRFVIVFQVEVFCNEKAKQFLSKFFKRCEQIFNQMIDQSLICINKALF